ncbi:hypothetical protein P153DRAFT_371991 [Dothidotthia symphoricarpi CBS 119687]|uniref:PHD-type domain-containing protein n=1 Tax=Dothidotthia symphoricarpi CBS 119687 TaxID=1392245 RepID=A0A6A6AS87_9PLEO|nr:uncharacterized protein P153DRAFT_371991 [Dothidotthia symphoricarpi CBS 119687]KAF2134660.1 hypothetical protein P153DRAFT_371991 [Dothidotthia symphoricarpi CBS 119687]
MLSTSTLLLILLTTLTMHIQATPLPIRILTHNIRYATPSPFKGENPWPDRKPLILSELHYHTLHNPQSFICLQEVLHEQLLDIMAGLGPSWSYIGVGRDDGKQAGEYSPILFRTAVWSVETWRTVWLSPTPGVPSRGWDAGSIRIVTVGVFVHCQSKNRVLGLSTHFDNEGEVSRRESAEIILGLVADYALPVFLAGDLNSEPDGDAHRLLSAEESPLRDARVGAEWRYGEGATYYTLANPDTLTKYKVAAEISQKVLKEVSGWCTEGASIVELCERGDKLLEEEVGKVYKGKKVRKGVGHCTTVSPSSYITPYTPLKSDAEESTAALKSGEVVKIQLGAQIDGLCTIVCDSVIVGSTDEVTGREADLILATYYANELLLRLMVPPGLVASGDEEEQKKASAKKPYTQSQITHMLEKVAKAYECNIVESTTIWQFEHNEIESKKKIILSPGDGVKGDGLPEVGDVWGVEIGVSLGSGKVKNNGNRTTLHRRTATTYQLKRPTSRSLLSEVVKKFGTFPFSLRQLEDEKAAKVGVVECVRTGVFRQYDVVVDKDSKPVARLFSTVAITKNGLQRLAQPPALDTSKYKSDKKIEDEEILKILEQPLGKATTKKNKKKKKKPSKKAAAPGEAAAEEEEEEEDEEVSHVAMPALRKSGRAGPRTSTTPYASPTATPGEPAREKSQRSIMEWAEPTPQLLAPSFEEHGFARHGVLETMAPLGVPPSSKVKQRARAMGDPAARRSFLGKGITAMGEEAGSTPEVTPAPELERDDSERPDEDELPPDFVLHDEDEDDDYVPAKSKKKVQVSKTPVRGKTPGDSKTPVKAKSPAKNGTSKAASVPPSPAVEASQQPYSVKEDAQRMTAAVNDAVIRANMDNKHHVGLALLQMFQQSKSDASLAVIMEAVIHQKFTEEQWNTFRICIKGIRKQLRNRDKLQRAREDRDGQQSTGIYGASSVSQQPSVRASSELAPDDSASAAGDQYPALQSSIERAFAPAPLHPLSTAPALPMIDSSAESTPRMPSKSPRKRPATNGHLAPGFEMDIDGVASTTAPTPAAKTPDTGAGSDSELSDVNEEIVQKGPPEPVQVNGKTTTTTPATAPKKGKNIAAARAAKKPKGNAGKLFGKHANKPQPLTAEQIAEDERVYEERQRMVLDQPLRKFDHAFPISDVRFDDEILETESLTESQIAVGPPVDSDQPRRAGRVPHHGTKRLREDASRFSSPQLESAAVTRPSTPAVAPAPKRLKLTHGQAARTKRSPVKNREGQPIAGRAFNSGGGPRQLGPDDNDPNSPQSESDDLCSACRGAGEFVCCEGCPRVFHLLCCDPPRIQVPDGSFYCYECTAKLGPPEDPTAESRSSLGPLFKSLERSNPRAFALPQDVQTHFENVTARADGSYFEEMKKFPLAKNSGYGYQRPDYTKALDSDHKPILCVQCGVSSGNKRQMLKCDFCPAHWHLDCLDPPLANPPHISLEASQRDAWRCPRHIEHDLRSGLLMQKDLNEPDNDVDMDGVTPLIRVARKIRKPREPEVIEPTFSRGMRNNGLIEIINDPDDDTDGEGNYVFGPDDSKDLNSKVFRAPEKGIVLDFVSKVKRARIVRDYEARNVSKAAAARRKASMQDFVSRPIKQQQAALNLARLANKEEDIGLSEGNIDALILSLTAEAPNDVITALSTAAPPPVIENERAQLLLLQELIQRRLNG